MTPVTEIAICRNDVMPELELYRINSGAIPAALERARQYRLLLEPEQAESICLDILAVDADHHQAQIVLILALTDQFSHSSLLRDAKSVLGLIDNLADEYERLYYHGLVSERRARAMMSETMSRSFAWEYFHEAMRWYEQATALASEYNDEAKLRWNACVRTLERERLQPRADRDELHLDMES
jgi:hypothetical protein